MQLNETAVRRSNFLAKFSKSMFEERSSGKHPGSSKKLKWPIRIHQIELRNGKLHTACYPTVPTDLQAGSHL